MNWGSVGPVAPAWPASRVLRPAPLASRTVPLSTWNVMSWVPTFTVNEESDTAVTVPLAVFARAAAGRAPCGPARKTNARTGMPRNLIRPIPPPSLTKSHSLITLGEPATNANGRDAWQEYNGSQARRHGLFRTDSQPAIP